MRRVTVIPCGGVKRTGAWPARDLYIGGHFTLGRRAAEALGDPWLILSGKYGLLEPGTVVDSYEQRVPKNSPEYVELLRGQARDMIGMQTRATLLLPAAYSRQLRAAAPWMHVVDVFDWPDMRIGKQRHVLSRIIESERPITAREVYV